MSVTNVTCPHCFKTNRIPAERISDGPKCGACKNPLFDGHPLELTATNANTVLAHTDIPVLVDCWAPWCGPCRSFAPVFEQAAREYEPKIRFAKLNTEDNRQLGGQWGIRSIPTLILFRDGREVDRVSGALPPAQLKQWLSQQGVL